MTLFSRLGSRISQGIFVLVFGLLLVPVSAFAADGVIVDRIVSLISTEVDGAAKITRLVFAIDNPNDREWQLVGAAPYGFLVTMDGNDIDIVDVALVPRTDDVLVIVSLDEEDADLKFTTDGVNSFEVEIGYTQETGDATCSVSCVRDNVDSELMEFGLNDDLVVEWDLAGPVLARTQPEDGDFGVDLNEELVFIFSERMITDFEEGINYTITPHVDFAVNWSLNSTKLSLVPVGGFEEDEDYVLEFLLLRADGGLNSPDIGDFQTLSHLIGQDAIFEFSTRDGVFVPYEPRREDDLVIYPSEALIEVSAVDACTVPATVEVSFSAKDATRLVIADNADFFDAELVPFDKKHVQSFEVPESGMMTIYAFFESMMGNRTNVMSQEIVVDATDCVDEEVAEEVDFLELPESAVSPVTGELELVSAVKPGYLIKGASYDTVYLVTADGMRRPFMNEQTYFTHFISFDDVVEVSDATLTVLPLGAPVLPKVGVVLVKLQSDPKVYALAMHVTDSTKAVRRHVSSEELAGELYGASWADYVIDVDATMYDRFEEGAAMTSEDVVDRAIMKKRVDLN